MFLNRLHSRKWYGSKPSSRQPKVSRKFHNISEERLNELKTRTMKKRSETKMMLAVRAYNQWHLNKLQDVVNFDYKIFDSNLDNVDNLDKENFEYSLCRFVPEVTKVKDGSDYPGKTLYEMCVALQKFVNEKGKQWKLVDRPDFKQLRIVLDNVMKERSM